jgi:ribose 5-phosphate isomerase A
VSGEGVSEDDLKRAAALAALGHVQSGMRLGLGTGSTSAQFIRALGERLAAGDLSGVVGTATSEASTALAAQVGIPLGDLDARPLDLAVDGADELDPDLNAVKGRGGALTREKLVAASAKRFILIADVGKRVERLGEKAPIPVEVVPFGWQATAARLSALGLTPALREGPGGPFVTDNHNYILDCRSEGPFDPAQLARAIKGTLGVLEHGLFLGMADVAYLAGPEGVLELARA